MTKIIDPDSLVRASSLSNLGTDGNIFIDTDNKKIYLGEYGDLTADGVTLQCVYSYTKEEWKDDNLLNKFQPPIFSITNEQFEVINGWNFGDTTTINLIRDGGWAVKDTSGNSQEEYMNVTTLGSFNDPATDKAYYLQVTNGTPVDAVYTGPLNQAVKIYGDTNNGNFDYRTFFQIFLRVQGKKYDNYDLISQQNISSLTYKKYAMPLSNEIDLKVTHSDSDIDNNAPYTGMSITYYTTAQTRNIGGTDYNFSIIIDGNSGSAEEIYEFVQRQLRKSTDIDADDDTKRGDISESLLQFVGDALHTLYTSEGGVYIDNFDNTDINRLYFTDDTGVERNYPYVAAGKIYFNENLQNDTNSKYWMYFTNDDAGDNAGNDFGTANAIIVQDKDSNSIQGDVSGASFISFSYDYDGNTQRGSSSAGKDAPITLVAIGLELAQYVSVTGTIVKSTQNNFSLIAPTERNYLNN